jgi:hypothetical protein
MDDTLLHVYGAVRAGAPLPDPLAGRGGRPVRLVEHEGLAMLVSEVDSTRVGRDDLLAHAHLLEAVAAETTVVPTRFGVLLEDEDTVRREFLVERRGNLESLLTAFDGCIQVTVRATYDEDAALREVLRRDPELAQWRASIDPADTAAQVRLGEAVGIGLDAVRDDAARMVVEWLRPYALATSIGPVRGAFEVANVALLVRRADRAQADSAVGDLDRRLEGQMSLRYVGPQPPYAFLDHVVIEEPTWA